ncbi:GNAT family N-acetyltransferase [Flavobacterium microcysteis]
MIIREYTVSDKPRLVELLKLNTPEFFSPNEEKDLLYYLDNEADNYFVLVMEDKVVGCGGFNLTEDGKTAKISWDIFDPNCQGKGLGSALTRFRIEKIKENKEIKTLSVRTSQLVYPFYEKFGLKLREVVKDYWDEGFDLYQLDCDIDSI